MRVTSACCFEIMVQFAQELGGLVRQYELGSGDRIFKLAPRVPVTLFEFYLILLGVFLDLFNLVRLPPQNESHFA